ncbi:MAG TPA: CorA family divalent cation transporter [Gemmatimonadales bacterium]|nr:CorA family divalent cation transporter [Gemmatimonadales bacterium]
MIRTILRAEHQGVTWIDVTAPSVEELHELARLHRLHETTVEDCLDPTHLPKYERIDDALFMILRVWGERPDRSGTAVQDVTRKIAMFSRGDLLLTIHRAELPALQAVEREWSGRCGTGEKTTVPALLAAIAIDTLGSYDAPLEEAEVTLETFEQALFEPKVKGPDLNTIHQLKRRIGLIRRLLWLMSSVVTKFGASQERTTPVYQDVRDTAESYLFYADQLLDETQGLLATYLAVASHRTNEVMRVLTVFSAFFLPLTFIVGVYGMNFEHMPELSQRWGYPMVLLAMAVVSLVIMFWFRRRGWLRRVADEDVD